MATKKPAPKKAAVKSAKKTAPAKKAAPAAKSGAAKASAKKAVPAKKSAPAKKAAPVKKAAPAKKVVPAKKAAPVKKAAPAKKAAVVKKVAPVKKANPAPVKKVTPAPVKKAAPAPVKKAAPVPAKKTAAPTPVKKAVPASNAKKAAPAPAKKAAPAPSKGTTSSKAHAKKVPMISPETRFAETSKVTASPAEIRKALREKEAKKDSKPVPMPKITAKSSRKYEPEFTKSVLDSQAAAAPAGPSQRYSDAELTEFRELVQNKLNAAKQELAYLNGLITRKDSMSGEDSDTRYMTMEDGSLSMEREQLSQMASRQIDFIEKLEKAMMRIENKTYGICRVTGKLIDKARLKAVPHATLSMEAKLNMNRPGASFNQ